MQFEEIHTFGLRGNLSEALVPLIRERIVDGTLPAGSRINEVRLSEKMGVTRTPLREALTLLAAEGALTKVPRRGYFVRSLSIEEVEEIYPIRAGLDPLALRLSGIPGGRELNTLDEVNAAMPDITNAHQRVECENQWHFDLYAKCPNQTLIGLIDQFMKRTARYEIVSMASDETISNGVTSRTNVIAALRNGDMDRAAELLQAGLLSGKVPVVRWLRQQIDQ